MSDAKTLLNEITKMKAIIAPVLLCNPKTKKSIEDKVKQEFPDVYLIEHNYVEPNSVIVVKDLELKKTFIEVYENQKKQREGSQDCTIS